MLTLRLLLASACAFGYLLVCLPLAARANEETTQRALKFIKHHDDTVRPLDVAGNLAWWNANTTGNPDDFAKKEAAQNRIDEALANPSAFAELKALKQAH